MGRSGKGPARFDTKWAGSCGNRVSSSYFKAGPLPDSRPHATGLRQCSEVSVAPVLQVRKLRFPQCGEIEYPSCGMQFEPMSDSWQRPGCHPACPSWEWYPEGGSQPTACGSPQCPCPGHLSGGRACPQIAMHEAGGTSSRRRTAHLVISRDRWLNSVTPGARFSLMLSESRCLERGSGPSLFEG